MKVLLDANGLVAALVARGGCSDLLEHCVRHHVVMSSRPLLDELRDVLTRTFHQPAVDVRSTVRLFAETFTSSHPMHSNRQRAATAKTCRVGDGAGW